MSTSVPHLRSQRTHTSAPQQTHTSAPAMQSQQTLRDKMLVGLAGAAGGAGIGSIIFLATDSGENETAVQVAELKASMEEADAESAENQQTLMESMEVAEAQSAEIQGQLEALFAEIQGQLESMENQSAANLQTLMQSMVDATSAEALNQQNQETLKGQLEALKGLLETMKTQSENNQQGLADDLQTMTEAYLGFLQILAAGPIQDDPLLLMVEEAAEDELLDFYKKVFRDDDLTQVDIQLQTWTHDEDDDQSITIVLYDKDSDGEFLVPSAATGDQFWVVPESESWDGTTTRYEWFNYSSFLLDSPGYTRYVTKTETLELDGLLGHIRLLSSLEAKLALTGGDLAALG